MSKKTDALRHSLMVMLTDEPAKPKRKYTPMSMEARDCMIARREGIKGPYTALGPTGRKPGRPPGSKNKKPKEYGGEIIPRPRIQVDLDHTNVHKYFMLHNEGILRMTQGLVGESALYKKQGNKKLSRHYHGWLVRFRNRDYDASLVAWWLLRGHVPDRYTVKCSDLGTIPRFNVDTLYLELIK